MAIRPRDITDLYLSPVVLELDRRLAGLTARTRDQLDIDVALTTDRQPTDAASRAKLMIESLTHLMALHGWEVAWDPRGLKVSHAQHALVLGVPESVRQYVEA